MNEAEQFEKGLKRHLEHFSTPPEHRKKVRRSTPSPTVGGYQVQLIVREGRLSPDTLFVHESAKVSQLEAQLDAERAARAAGWPIIGRVHEIVYHH